MISPRLLRRRIRSIQSTAKITKAMEMIATAKMKHAQEQALAGRPYNNKITQLIADLAAASTSSTEVPLHPLLEHRDLINKAAIIHITSDRGLCGGLNTNVNRLCGNFIVEQNIPVSLVTVGRKGRDFMYRSMRDIRAEFSISDPPTLFDTLPISRLVIDDYTDKYVDVVYISYTKYESTMTQKPVIETLLPIKPESSQMSEPVEYIYEPDPNQVFQGLLPRYVEMKIFHAIREAVASEHSARMIAMRNATENANEIVDHLVLTLNKARQEMITTELLDITGGVEVLN